MQTLSKTALFLCCGLIFWGCSICWAREPTNAKWLQQPKKPATVAETYQRLLKQTPDSLEALERLEQLLLRWRRYDDLMWVADMLVGKGELEEAKKLLQTLAGKLPKQAGRIRFEIAQIHYFQGEFQQMLRLCQQLIRGATAEDYVNDALEKMVFVRENLNPPEALRLFATAQLLLRQQKYSQALRELEQLQAEFPHSTLSDDLLLLESRVKDQMGDFQPAIDALRKLLSEYPQSPLCAQAQKRIGEIYERRLQDYQGAEREYKLFLLHYPQSVMASEVRGMLQRLKTKAIRPLF